MTIWNWKWERDADKPRPIWNWVQGRAATPSETREAIGCLAMFVLIALAIGLMWLYSDRETARGIRKLNYCAENAIDLPDCRMNWRNIPELEIPRHGK